MSQSLSLLPIGARVKAAGTKYNGEVLVFTVGCKGTVDVSGSAQVSAVGLITANIISFKCFDEKEPAHKRTGIQYHGNSNYVYANIRRWLNSYRGGGASGWYADGTAGVMHDADAPPDGDNAYFNEAGFLSNLEWRLRDKLLSVFTTIAHSPYHSGGHASGTTRRARLLTRCEAGFGPEPKYKSQEGPRGQLEGKAWPLFTSNSSRCASPTRLAVQSANQLPADFSPYNWDSPCPWWLATGDQESDNEVRVVNQNGALSNHYASNAGVGVRPVIFLRADTLVSNSPDSDGVYTFDFNRPPSAPPSISYGTPYYGRALTLSCGGASDPDGDSLSYVWEQRADSGAFRQIGVTTAPRISATVPASGTNYQARVKAVDPSGLESAYCTGSWQAMKHYNTPPVVSGSSNTVGGNRSNPMSREYTVTDAESATQTLTVRESVEHPNGSKSYPIRTHQVTAGQKYTALVPDLTWLQLTPDVQWRLTITASDGAGGSDTKYTGEFRRVDRVAASRAFATSAKVSRVLLNFFPAELPAGAVRHVEVTNNPFDTKPVWEDISSKVGRFVHTFANTTVAKGNGLGYRFYLTKGTSQVEVSQVLLKFS